MPLMVSVGIAVCTLGLIALLHAGAPYPDATIDERETCTGLVAGMCVVTGVIAIVVWGLIAMMGDAATRSSQITFDVGLAQTALVGYLAVSIVASLVFLRAVYGVTEYRPQDAVEGAEDRGPIDRVVEQYVDGEIGDQLLERKLEAAVGETDWSESTADAPADGFDADIEALRSPSEHAGETEDERRE